MIRSLRFHNYRVLRDAELPLQPFTLLVGPNGSGKSTVMHALKSLRTLASQKGVRPENVLSLAAGDERIEIAIEWANLDEHVVSLASGKASNTTMKLTYIANGRLGSSKDENRISEFLQRMRVYVLNENAIINAVALQPHMQLEEDGTGLAGVLDRMRDQSPENFEALNEEVRSLLPEFDRILFETPSQGMRSFTLRTREGQHVVRAANLSQGTVLALTILTLAHLSNPPSMICLEEPDRGIHPRLYREIQDALYRLAYPQSFGLDRAPVQVLVTTHSPYLLDLHRDHPEEVVIAQKNGASATFQQLTQRDDLQDLLRDASLGELWYSGVLGGVPVS
jgi:predicted ATPase